jgi:peptide chain release factor 2
LFRAWVFGFRIWYTTFMEDLNNRVSALFEEFKNIRETINIAEKQEQLRILESESMNPKLWDDPEAARKTMQNLDAIKSEILEIEKLQGDIETLSYLANESGITEDLRGDVQKTEKEFQKFKLKSFLSGPYDKRNAIMTLVAGQGGTEAMDWTSILYRMYIRFCENREWKTEMLDISEGEEAGYKSVTFKITGAYAYGYMKGEAGTHRLVRKSPFNANNLRQTSFALAEVLPELEEMDEVAGIEIKNEDLEFQFYRSGGSGGQNVNKVSTAVRLIHQPTGLVVSAQTERFQEANRKIAMELLRAKLWAREQAMHEANVKDLKGEYRPASWGNQIRSYVLDKKLIKDLRTLVETGNTEAVLNGDLDEFIEAELRLQTKS